MNKPQRNVQGSSWCGVQNKLTAMIYLMVVFSMTTVAYYGYQSARTAYYDKALSVAGQGVRDTGRAVKEFLRTIPNDLTFVSSFYAMKRYLYWQDLNVDYKASEWENAALETFRSFLLSRDHYYKLRFINTKGLEQIAIRYDRKNGNVYTEPQENLQDKRHSDYFLEPMKIGREGIYLSAINLSEEHGKIEKPHVPVLRFARPVIGDNNVRYGVAVLNVYADVFLERIGQNIEKNRNRYLISASGDYFYHPDGKAWGHLLGEQAGFHIDFPEIFARLKDQERGAFTFAQQIICFERIYPHPQHTDTFWFLIEIMDKDTFMQQVDRFVRFFILIFFVTLLLVFLISRHFIGGLIRPLLVITRQLRQLSLGKIDKEELVYNENDEIGQMIQYTGKLVTYLEDISRQADRISAGNYAESVSVLSEQDRLGNAVNNMTLMIRENQQKNEEQNWLTQGQGQLDNLLRGEQSLEDMANDIVTFLASYLEAGIGAFYLSDDEGVLHLYAGYAYRRRKNLSNEFKLGEGMVGQAALEKKIIIISHIPERYLQVCSALGEGESACLLIAPFLYNNQVKAVLEIGSFVEISELQINFIEQIGERVGIALNSAQSRLRMQEVLLVTRQQAAELQSRQEELQASNEELEEQTQRLRASEEELQANQDQLVTTNAELEKKNTSLNRQKQAIGQANEELRDSRKEIERKAEEVAKASRYKSEFLANMSHELRTPLNSLLLLAQTLEANRQGNLTEEDIEAIKVIHHSGGELLALINDILDLSKIEAGQMTLVQDHVALADVFAELTRTFRHQVEKKGLTLHFHIADEVPENIRTDRQRLEQILNNLLSNALKFTEQGEITVSVSRALSGIELHRPDLSPESALAVTVQDSGIGIPFAKQQIIFEAFQQADGGTARKYGGTGLGLSIARNLAGLLGGEIHLESKEGKGARFILYLPTLKKDFKKDIKKDVRDNAGLAAPRKGAVAALHKPVSREQQEEAFEDIKKTAKQQGKTLLVAAQDPEQRAKIITLIAHKDAGNEGVGNEDVQSEEAGSGQEVLDKLRDGAYDCLIMGIEFPDMSGNALLKYLKDEKVHVPPVIVYTGKKISWEESAELEQYANSIIIKGVMSEERLLDESSLFLHRIISDLPEKKQRMMRNLHEDDVIFEGKRILLVDDDMRNLFALAKVLGDKGMQTVKAEDGAASLAALEQKEAFDLVLMDIMMPVMDGYEAIEKIRSQPQWKDLPIIALTAKAMKDDRSRCLSVGANDYLAKPVDVDRLLALLRLWLYR